MSRVTSSNSRGPRLGTSSSLRSSVVLSLVIGLVVAMIFTVGQVERTFDLWTIPSSSGEVFRLRAGQTVTQIINPPLGVFRGFRVSVKPQFTRDEPVEFVLRLRKAEGAREILREAAVLVDQGGEQKISSGLWPPLTQNEKLGLMLEIGLAPGSSGQAIVYATDRGNLPAGGVAVNGAPSPELVRVNVVPVVTVSTPGLLRDLLAENPPVFVAYLGASIALVGAFSWMVIGSRHLPGHKKTSMQRLIAVAGLAAVLWGMALVVGTATFVSGTLRPVRTEIFDGYWSAALAIPWIAVVIAVTVHVGMRWWGNARLLGVKGSELWRPGIWWRPAIGLSLAMLLAALAPKVWGQEALAQTMGAASVSLLAAGILGGMLDELRR